MCIRILHRQGVEHNLQRALLPFRERRGRPCVWLPFLGVKARILLVEFWEVDVVGHGLVFFQNWMQFFHRVGRGVSERVVVEELFLWMAEGADRLLPALRRPFPQQPLKHLSLIHI